MEHNLQEEEPYNFSFTLDWYFSSNLIYFSSTLLFENIEIDDHDKLNKRKIKESTGDNMIKICLVGNKDLEESCKIIMKSTSFDYLHQIIECY